MLLFLSVQVCVCTGKFLCHCDGVKGQKVRIADDVKAESESVDVLSVGSTMLINVFSKNEIVVNWEVDGVR